MLPDEVIEYAFEEHQLKYVRNETIPADLTEQGWYSKNYVKDLNDGSYICVHLIFGPDSTGKSIVKRNDRVRIKTKTQDGQNFTFSSEWIDREITEKSDPCTDFFKRLG